MQAGKNYLNKKIKLGNYLEIILFSSIENFQEFIMRQKLLKISGIIGVSFLNHLPLELFFVLLWIKKMFNLYSLVHLKKSFKTNSNNL
jgi:hypothetical protein